MKLSLIFESNIPWFLFLLNLLQRQNNAILKLLDPLSHILTLVLALYVEVNNRYITLAPSILWKQLILHFLVEILFLSLLLLYNSTAALWHRLVVVTHMIWILIWLCCCVVLWRGIVGGRGSTYFRLGTRRSQLVCCARTFASVCCHPCILRHRRFQLLLIYWRHP